MCRWWYMKINQFMNVKRPRVITMDNGRMVRVNLPDRVLAFYHTGAKSQKSTGLLHFIDLASVGQYRNHKLKYLEFEPSLDQELETHVSETREEARDLNSIRQPERAPCFKTQSWRRVEICHCVVIWLHQ